ncbi:MAG: hypothetical protein FJY07_13740 [Bacteroidetes bacterium]|nr:hypothetical protein [Bacteroidota bacterium]
MESLKIRLSPSGSLSDLKTDIESLLREGNIGGLVVMTCEANNYTPKILNPLLNSLPLPVFGGIFPGILYGNQKHSRGSLIIGLREMPEVHVIKTVSNPTEDFYISMSDYFKGNDELKTVFIFVDGTSQNTNKFIESLFIVFGLEYNFIGGGAGSVTMEPMPCIITNEGLLSDAVVIAGSKLNGRLSFKHGWKSIAGPFKVTGSNRNLLISLDFRPVMEIYREIVEPLVNQKITEENFSIIAAGYPFAITRLGTEKIIRSPLKIDSFNNIICACEIPEGVFVHILHAEKDDLFKAGMEAQDEALTHFDRNANDHFTFVIDCISRVRFLGDLYSKTLNILNDRGRPLAGILSLGEIANNGKEFLEFYNKTIVIACFNQAVQQNAN